MGKYYGEFTSRADVVACYTEAEVPQEYEIVYAWHSDPDYEESLTVVFVRDGKLYEVHDSHCSCNGWNDEGDLWTRPEETSIPALLLRRDASLAHAIGEFLQLAQQVVDAEDMRLAEGRDPPCDGLRAIAIGGVPTQVK